ncbi:DUF4249 domain-containing protein [Arcticibacter eurypsychrophilus]|uniref:DUF4249 domain-containing protein n=1 Tax=Arcticibacter eurypsychrophilus TaxID=1434752 RepID=UPI00084DE901|nr:DUF4249 domain-containing protein [Arcticibacter eurypsychrophilus]
MRKQSIYQILFLAATISLSSCEKVIDVKLDSSANQVVIEGNITDQQGPQTIKISQSVPYTDSNVYPAVTGAVVTVTDDAGGSWLFSEAQPGNYSLASFRGVPGRTYTLHVNANNVTYTAMSTMPKSVALDSLSVDVISFGGNENKQVQVHFKDPGNQINQYLYFMKINGVQAKSIFVENDRFTNGNDISSVLFYFSENDDEDLKSGDQVEVEMQSIDKSIFTYWFTLSQQTQNGPGGGVTPGNPPSNINNNALGYFSAHTTERKTLTIE